MSALERVKNIEDELLRYRRKALRDVRWYFEDFANYPLFDWQYSAIDAALDVPRNTFNIQTVVNVDAKPRVTVRSCHGTGKTTLLAALTHIWNFIFIGCRVVATAPKQDQLLRRLLPRYRDILAKHPKSYSSMVEVLGREVTIAGNKDWGLALETATEPEALAGYHDKPQLFLIDEASSKRLDPMFPTIEGALTYEGSVIVEIGNPTRVTGEFFQHHVKKDLDELYFRIHVKHTDAPEVISKSWVESMRRKYGPTSPVYKIRVLGEFASFDEATLIPLDYIEDAYESKLEDDGSIPELRIAVDVSDGGEDDTCITAGFKYATYTHVKEQKSYSFPPSESAIDSAIQAIKMFNQWGGDKARDVFIVDANGCGAGTAGYLIKEGYQIIRHVGGEESDDPQRYRNRRVQNHITCADALKEAKVRIDKQGIEDVFDFEGEMVSVKRAEGEDSKLDDIQTAKSLKAELGFSPDKLNSFTMLFHGQLPETDSFGEGDFMIQDSSVTGQYY